MLPAPTFNQLDVSSMVAHSPKTKMDSGLYLPYFFSLLVYI